MIGGVLVTVVLFMIAVTLCIVTNLVVFRYLWNSAPSWVQYIAYVVCTIIIMVTLYHAVGYVWGVYDIR